MALHLPLSLDHETPLHSVPPEPRVSAGVPPVTRSPTSSTPPGVATPTLGVVVLSLGDAGSLGALLEGLVPACREYVAELVVVRRGPPTGTADLDRAGVRVVFGKPADGEAELRALGMRELGADVTIFTSDTAPGQHDWNELLPQVGQTVQLRHDEVPPNGWVARLRQANVPDPAA